MVNLLYTQNIINKCRINTQLFTIPYKEIRIIILLLAIKVIKKVKKIDFI